MLVRENSFWFPAFLAICAEKQNKNSRAECPAVFGCDYRFARYFLISGTE